MAPGVELAAAYVSIVPSTKGIAADLRREFGDPVDKAAKEAGRSIEENVGGGAKRGADAAKIALTAIGSAAVLAGINKAKDAASGLQQAVGGTAAVFQDASGAVDQFAENAAESVGLSQRAARELTSQIGASLKGFGFSVDAAAAKSIELTQLGADLAATFGGTTADAVAALSSALRGEFDPLERYGVALRQTAIDAEAARLGLVAEGQEVDAMARSQAALSLITQQSADAQGQFARESDSAAGQAQISSAKIEDAAANLGEALLPIYARVSETIGSVADVFAGLPGPIQTAIIAAAGFAAVAGPIRTATEAIGGLTNATGGLRTGASTLANILAGGRGGLLGVLGPVGAAAGLAGIAWLKYASSQEQAAGRVQELTEALTDQNAPITENITRAFSARLSSGLTEGLNAINVSAREAEAAITGTAAQAAILEVQLKDAGYGDAGAEVLRLRRDFEAAAGEMINAAIAEERFSAASLEAELRAAGFGSTATQLARALEDGAIGADELLGSSITLGPIFDLLGVEAPDAAGGIDEFGGAATEATAPTRDFAAELQAANQELSDLFNISDSIPVIETNLREALRDAADEAARLAENTATNEERYDAFIGMVSGAVGDLDGFAQGLIDQGVSADEAAFRTNLYIDEIFGLRDEFGLSEEAAADLRTQLGLVYPTVTAEVRQVGIAETNAELEELQENLSAFFSAQTMRLLADGASLEFISGGARASGGPVWPGTWLVGEEGPEVISVGGPGYVHNATDTAAMLDGLSASSAGGFVQNIYQPIDPVGAAREARKLQMVWS